MIAEPSTVKALGLIKTLGTFVNPMTVSVLVGITVSIYLITYIENKMEV